MILFLLMQFKVVEGAKHLEDTQPCMKHAHFLKGMLEARNVEVSLVRRYKLEDRKAFRKAIVRKAKDDMMAWALDYDETMVFVQPEIYRKKTSKLDGRTYYTFARVMVVRFMDDEACLYIFRSRSK